MLTTITILTTTQDAQSCINSLAGICAGIVSKLRWRGICSIPGRSERSEISAVMYTAENLKPEMKHKFNQGGRGSV